MDIAYYSRTSQRYVCIYIFVSGKSYVAELRIVYSYINSLYMSLQWDLVYSMFALVIVMYSHITMFTVGPGMQQN